MNIDHIKYFLQEQIEFEERMIENSAKNDNDLNYCWGSRNLKVYQDLMTIVDAYSNGKSLHLTQKKCTACGKMFTPKNNLQECCDTKCRVRLHRAKNRLKDFNKKVEAILKAKDQEAKFTVEQIISDKCPFVVTYKGIQYKSDNTRNLLTQLKKI